MAGACFILPAMLLVIGCGWIYVKFGALPQAGAVLYGVKPVIIAIVAQALWGLGKSALKTPPLAVIATAVAAASFLGVERIAPAPPRRVGRVVCGALSRFLRHGGGNRGSSCAAAERSTGGHDEPLPVAAVSVAGVPFGLWPMFLFFLKVGSVLFGSGYVLLAFLRADLVERWHWLTDAAAPRRHRCRADHARPGLHHRDLHRLPAWRSAGLARATLGIFLPAFFSSAISAPFIPVLRASPMAAALLDGVNAASLALMAVVTWHLGRGALTDLPTVALSLLAALALIRFRVNSAWLVLAGAAAGLLLGKV